MRTGTLDLMANLNDPNGWTRDTAQRLLVEKSDASAAEPLIGVVRADHKDASATHALWTLNGINKLDASTITTALSSRNPNTRATAVRLAGERAASDSALRDGIIQAAADSDPLVQLHAAFALGPVAKEANALSALARIVETHANEPLFRDAAISGLRDQEIAFAEFLMKRPEWQQPAPGFDKVLARLAHAAAASSRKDPVNRILEMAAGDDSWHRAALINGIVETAPGRGKGKTAKAKLIHVDSEPAALAALRKDSALAEKIKGLEDVLVWPGKVGVAEKTVRPLTAAEKEQFDLGKQTYLLTCAACHQPHGLGQEGLAPPLVDSDWVTGSEKRIARIVLQGVRGPINVNGKLYSLEMPPLGILEDQQIAAILTYVRSEWNHTASPVTTEFVAKTRTETTSREEPWNEKDLLKIQ
jgi:mono/diheme cytochrome c family protein